MFEPGRLYQRNEVHLVFGGSTRLQARGGILTPRDQPLIVLVSGDAGHRYGYGDFWDADGVFHYYGAGQEGPMGFVRGNRALRDRHKNGEDVYLFEEAGPGMLRYRGQLVCAGYYEQDDVPDVRGKLRRAIVFLLGADRGL